MIAVALLAILHPPAGWLPHYLLDKNCWTVITFSVFDDDFVVAFSLHNLLYDPATTTLFLKTRGVGCVAVVH